MKKNFKRRLFKGGTQACSILLVLAVGTTAIAQEWSSKVNEVLGTSSFRFEQTDSEDGDKVYFKSDYGTVEDLISAREDLIRRTVGEGAVLLKNQEGTLPLGTDAKITILGSASYHSNFCSTTGGASFDTTMATRLADACESVGIAVNPVMKSFYETYGQKMAEIGVNPWTGDTMMGYVYQNSVDVLGEVPLDKYTQAERDSYKEYNDAAVVVISRTTGEGTDFSAEPLSVEKGGDGVHHILQLSDTERALISDAKANFERVIVYVNTDNMIEIEELKQDSEIDAILYSGGVGKTGMYGIADILSGTVAPSGSLADTIVVSNVNTPAYQNFGAFTFDSNELEGDNYTHYVVYAEGIYGGYKYYNTRYEDVVMGTGNANGTAGSIDGEAWDYNHEVTYGFGEGLSYTTFETKMDSVDVDLETMTGEAKVTVTNTGDTAAKKSVQIYVQSPYTDYDKENGIEKAAVQLVGYDKSNVIEPGASETVTVSLDIRNMTSYDSKTAKAYMLDAGKYYFATGNGAHDATNNILAAKGFTVADGMDADGSDMNTVAWDNAEMKLITEGVDGYQITNQFDDCDLNYYLPETVTYLTRSDWEGTWPKPYENIAPTEEMVALLNTYQDKDASYVQDTSITLDGLTTNADNGSNLMMLYDVREDYDNPLWNDLLNQMSLEDYCYSIYTLYPAVASVNMPSASNTDSPNGLNAGFNMDPNAAYHVDEATASDEIKAYKCNTYPSGTTRACTFSHTLATETGRMMANDGLWTGKAGQTGPGANLHRTAFSGRNNEYYSEDGVLTALTATDEVKQMTELGLAAAPKHFAFNDQETYRQGLACFFNEQTARESVLRAFEGIYRDGKPLYGMSSFSRLGCEPSTSSRELLTNILRGEWGWKGFTMTDMAHDYMPVAASVIAGTDQWCAFSSDDFIPYLNEEELLKNPELAWACREAAHRIMFMTLNSNAINGLSAGAKAVRVTTPWEKALFAVDGTLAVLLLICLTGYILSSKKKVK